MPKRILRHDCEVHPIRACRSPEVIGRILAALLDRLMPVLYLYPGNTDVRVMFGEEQDEGVAQSPVILTIR